MEDVKQRIKDNRVVFKKDIDPPIKQIIFQMLQMAPKKRPSVKEILQNPFIRTIRSQMDAKFFVKGAQLPPKSPVGAREPRFDFNDFIPPNQQNREWKNNPNSRHENNSQSKAQHESWGVESSRQINRSQDPAKNYFKVKKNKFFSSQQNELPKPKIFQSTRQIPGAGHQNQSFYKGLSMNQSAHQGNASLSSSEKQGVGQRGYPGANKLFHFYKEKGLGEGIKCKTEPSSLSKQINYSSGHGKASQKYFSIFSKKKKANTESMHKDFSKFSTKLFKKKQEATFQKINNKHKFASFHNKIPNPNSRENLTFDKRDSSKENKKELESAQGDSASLFVGGKSNLKKLLKRHQNEKAQKDKKEPVMKPRDKSSSTKKNPNRNLGTSQKKHHFDMNRSFNNDLMRKRFGQHQQGSRKGMSREFNPMANQSMGGAPRKMKQQKSVKYINCEWRQPVSHVKSHSFNDTTLKTKLVLRRKDSIQDLKKKLSTRKIESILQKPRHKSNFLNVSYNNQGLLGDKAKKQPQRDYSRMGLKRNHSMATGLVPKITKTIQSSGKNPVVQKTLHGMIHHFKLNSYEKRQPVSNVFQLNSKPKKAEKTKSFCYSHRVDNLNPKAIMSKLKGISQRNIPNPAGAMPGKINFTKVYQTQNSSSRYQEPTVKTNYFSRNEQNWKSKFIQN